MKTATFEWSMSKKHRRNNCIGPECQRCCCFLYPSYDSGSSHKHCNKWAKSKILQVEFEILQEPLEKSTQTLTSFKYMNLHPQRWALTAISISSTVVRSNQPPQSSSALILQTPAVPLKPKKLMNQPFTCCSTSKWKAKFIFCNFVSKFSSLFTNDHLVWTNARSSLPYNNT